MRKNKSGVLSSILRIFFHLLYHNFSWTYDAVAFLVSLGRWQSWVRNSLHFIEGEKILELGYGPGHLQIELVKNGYASFGIDESMFMARQALHRFNHRMTKSYPDIHPRLVRGSAEIMPFTNDSFHSIVATFPTEYIFNPATLLEIKRVLKPNGKLVILLSAWPIGRNLVDRADYLLFRLTQQIPSQDNDYNTFVIPFYKAGFMAETRKVSLDTSELLYVLATKPGISPVDQEIAS